MQLWFRRALEACLAGVWRGGLLLNRFRGAGLFGLLGWLYSLAALGGLPIEGAAAFAGNHRRHLRGFPRKSSKEREGGRALRDTPPFARNAKDGAPGSCGYNHEKSARDIN